MNSNENFDALIKEVQLFVNELTKAVREKNFDAWKAILSDEYFSEASSPAKLQELSELPGMKNRGIVLKTAQDYFNFVFAPSRANATIDDIEFVRTDKVDIYTVIKTTSGEKSRMLLYSLGKINNAWKVIS